MSRVVPVANPVTAEEGAQPARGPSSTAESRYRLLFENSRDALFITDVDGHVIEANKAALRLFRLEGSVLNAVRLVDLYVDPADRERLMERIERKGWVRGFQVELRRTDGTTFSGRLTASAWHRPDGTVGGVEGIVHDVTDRLREEVRMRDLQAELEQRVAARTAELAAANKELEAFAYSVSHDLRAPLRSLDGFAQALLEDYADRLDETGLDYLRRVRGASQRMGMLIDDLLKLSRVQRSEIRREEVDLSRITEEVAGELAAAHATHLVDFRVEPGLRAVGDARLLRLVLTNLLGNAWKFTRRSEDPRVEVGSTRGDGPEVFHVRDNGVGFDMRYAEKLFQAFQRLHPLSEFEGTGIGLATVSRIIMRHGGRVWAESQPGAGATVYFTLR